MGLKSSLELYILLCVVFELNTFFLFTFAFFIIDIDFYHFAFCILHALAD